MQKLGRFTVLSEKEKSTIAEHLLATAEWGFPFDGMDIIMLVKNYLDKLRRNIERFKNNVPGPDWLESQLKRHSDINRMKLCQNITRKREAVSKTAIISYFNDLQETLQDILPQHIIHSAKLTFQMTQAAKK